MSINQKHNCNQCNKNFSRYEHLIRHINASHSNIRPYICTFCSRSFARSDVLSRHINLHTRPINPLNKDKRSRIHRACLGCKSSKVKCDGLKPSCSRCALKNIECSFIKDNINDQPRTHHTHIHHQLQSLQNNHTGINATPVRLPPISSWAPDLI